MIEPLEELLIPRGTTNGIPVGTPNGISGGSFDGILAKLLIETFKFS